MSIAAIASCELELTMEKANIEESITIIDQRKMMLAYQSGYLAEEESARWNEALEKQDEDDDYEFNYSELVADLETQKNAIEAREKIMDSERTNLQTRLEAINTELDGVTKKKEKNIESDFKNFS